MVWWWFGGVPLIGWLTNVVVLPFGSLVVIPLAHLFALSSSMPAVAEAAGAALTVAVHVLLSLCDTFAPLTLTRRLPPLDVAQGFIVLAGCLLLSSPTFADYPNSWRLKKTQLPSDGEFLIPERQEIWMPRPMDRQLGEPIREVIEKARGLTNDGERVAVIDSLRTFVYLEAGAKPWTGDAALFMNTWTREAARELVDRFRETGPRYVLIRRFPPNSKLIRDTWIELRESLRPTYHVVEQLSEFDLLRCDSCGDR